MYAPLAELFNSGGTQGGLRFAIEMSGRQPRARIDCIESGVSYYLSLVWQEDWTANPLARSKFITGKLVYQRELGAKSFYARPFKIVDSLLAVPSGGDHEEMVEGPLPSDALKLGCLS